MLDISANGLLLVKKIKWISSLLLSLKVFKQEVESHPWAVNHNIPKGFLHGLAAVSVSLFFAIYCAIPKHLPLLP